MADPEEGDDAFLYDSDDDDDELQHNAGATEAGIVRGVSRSVAQRAMAAKTAGRTLGKAARKLPNKQMRASVPKAAVPRGAKIPKVGAPRGSAVVSKSVMPKAGGLSKARVPKSAAARAPKAGAVGPKTATRVPVKRVAKVTDRMSTGLDVLDSATESLEEKTSASSQQQKQQQRSQQLARVGAFVRSLVKNTLIGTIVFESYCWIVTNSGEWSHRLLQGSDDKKQQDETTDASGFIIPLEQDVFETTPVLTHYLAGAAAGSLQGLATYGWDISAASITARKLMLSVPSSVDTAPLSRSMIQHGISHSLLFGSYESWKRLFLWRLGHLDSSGQDQHDKDAPQKRMEYFVGVAAAGGLAGQLQHVSSHVLEEQPSLLLFSGGGAKFRMTSLPSFRSTLLAFPPSAIAFLAFEYGKDMVSEMVEDDDDDG